MADSPWPTIHAERKALADDLAGLKDEQWNTPSLAAGWSVHDMLGHIVATAKMSPPRFLSHFIGSGFSFAKMADKDIKAETGGGPASTLAEFNAHLDSTSAPPGPVDAMLGEALIHSEDIRRPLGIKHEYPLEPTLRCLNFFKNSNLIIGAKSRIAGVTLKATDTDWSTGSGPEVTGPAHSLLMAMTGRKAALDDLAGPGVDVLRSR